MYIKNIVNIPIVNIFCFGCSNNQNYAIDSHALYPSLAKKFGRTNVFMY